MSMSHSVLQPTLCATLMCAKMTENTPIMLMLMPLNPTALCLCQILANNIHPTLQHEISHIHIHNADDR